MTKSADISRIGQIDLLIGQAQFNTTGDGSLYSVQVPSTLPAKNRFFLAETVLLILEDDNVGATSGFPFPATGFGAAYPPALAMIVAASVPPTNPANGLFARMSPTSAQCGPAIEFICDGNLNDNIGVTTIWNMQTARKVIIPQGQVLRIYIQDAGDAAAHVVTATLLVQVRWFDTAECEC